MMNKLLGKIKKKSHIDHDPLLRYSNCWNSGIIIVGDTGILGLYRPDSYQPIGPSIDVAWNALPFRKHHHST
jgi:hypothetical protein